MLHFFKNNIENFTWLHNLLNVSTICWEMTNALGQVCLALDGWSRFFFLQKSLHKKREKRIIPVTVTEENSKQFWVGFLKIYDAAKRRETAVILYEMGPYLFSLSILADGSIDHLHPYLDYFSLSNWQSCPIFYLWFSTAWLLSWLSRPD